MDTVQFLSSSPEATASLGESLGRLAPRGTVLALTGGLGAGKTLFAKGFALGLGISAEVTSPTFNLMNIYDGGRMSLVHFDLYRLEDESELDAIGFYEYADYPDGVALIEWADKFPDALPTPHIHVAFEGEGNARRITFTPVGGATMDFVKKGMTDK